VETNQPLAYRVFIINGTAVVNSVTKTDQMKTYQHFADSFLAIICNIATSYNEVRLVFDRYVKTSLSEYITVLCPFVRDHPGELVPEENFWTLWCKRRLTETETPTCHTAGRHYIRTNQCPPPPSSSFLQAGCPSCRPTNSVKALKAMNRWGQRGPRENQHITMWRTPL